MLLPQVDPVGYGSYVESIRPPRVACLLQYISWGFKPPENLTKAATDAGPSQSLLPARLATAKPPHSACKTRW